MIQTGAAMREAQAQALHLNHTGMVEPRYWERKSNTFQSTLETRSSPITVSFKANLRKKKNASISGL